MKDLFHHLFIPRHTNNHRAKVLHINALSIYLLFFLLVNISIRTVHTQAPQVLGYATNIYVEQLFADTNTVRIQAGLAPLQLNDQLSQAAATKAQFMFAKNFWAHNSPDGHTPWEFITAAGYKYTVAGENLAKNFNDSKSVVDAWMASPTHKENIIKASYKDVGFAVVNGKLNGEETTLVVQMFGNTSPPILTHKEPEVPTEQVKTQPASVPEAPRVGTVAQASAQYHEPVVDTTATQEVQTTSSTVFPGVSLRPFIDLNKLTKSISYAFVLLLITVFILDAYIVAKNKIVRITGHNVAHILFLISITIVLSMTVPGVIL